MFMGNKAKSRVDVMFMKQALPESELYQETKVEGQHKRLLVVRMQSNIASLLFQRSVHH